MKNSLQLILVLISSLFVVGCAKPMPGAYLVQPGKPLQKIDPNVVNQSNPVYKLSARDQLLVQVQMVKAANTAPKLEKGNQLTIGFFADDTTSDSYKLVPGDELSLEFPDEIQGTYTVLVNPDGRIALPKTGKSLQVSGTTLAELNQLSVKQYRGIFLKPKLAWSITRPFNARLEKMSGQYNVGANGGLVIQGLGAFNVLGMSEQAITDKITKAATAKFKNKVIAQASMAQAVKRNTVDTRLDLSGVEMYTNIDTRPIRVGDDGNIFIPTLGNIMAEGKTLNTLRTEVAAALQPKYQNPIHVNVSVQEYAENNIYIGGEVRKPGRYPYGNKLSILKLIAYAGWSNENADMGNVLLLRADANDGYTIYRTNLDEVIDGKASSAQDFKISPQDLVIVPPTDIVKKNRFVKQYLRGILPFGTNISYNINRAGFLN